MHLSTFPLSIKSTKLLTLLKRIPRFNKFSYLHEIQYYIIKTSLENLKHPSKTHVKLENTNLALFKSKETLLW